MIEFLALYLHRLQWLIYFLVSDLICKTSQRHVTIDGYHGKAPV